MSEPDAFRFIQKAAMDGRKSMREVAQVVLEESPTAGA
jgi:response regulator NasT